MCVNGKWQQTLATETFKRINPYKSSVSQSHLTLLFFMCDVIIDGPHAQIYLEIKISHPTNVEYYDLPN